MPPAKHRTGVETGTEALQALGPMLGFGESGLATLARMHGHAYKAALRYQIEGLSFLKHRCEQDMKLIDDLLATGDFSDAFDVYSGFWQNAMQEYSREASKVTEIGSKVASDATKQMHREAEQITENMAARTVG